jgi:hypothetical protein
MEQNNTNANANTNANPRGNARERTKKIERGADGKFLIPASEIANLKITMPRTLMGQKCQIITIVSASGTRTLFTTVPVATEDEYPLSEITRLNTIPRIFGGLEKQSLTITRVKEVQKVLYEYYRDKEVDGFPNIRPSFHANVSAINMEVDKALETLNHNVGVLAAHNRPDIDRNAMVKIRIAAEKVTQIMLLRLNSALDSPANRQIIAVKDLIKGKLLTLQNHAELIMPEYMFTKLTAEKIKPDPSKSVLDFFFPKDGKNAFWMTVREVGQGLLNEYGVFSSRSAPWATLFAPDQLESLFPVAHGMNAAEIRKLTEQREEFKLPLLCPLSATITLLQKEYKPQIIKSDEFSRMAQVRELILCQHYVTCPNGGRMRDVLHMALGADLTQDNALSAAQFRADFVRDPGNDLDATINLGDEADLTRKLEFLADFLRNARFLDADTVPLHLIEAAEMRAHTHFAIRVLPTRSQETYDGSDDFKIFIGIPMISDLLPTVKPDRDLVPIQQPCKEARVAYLSVARSENFFPLAAEVANFLGGFGSHVTQKAASEQILGIMQDARDGKILSERDQERLKLELEGLAPAGGDDIEIPDLDWVTG